MHIKIKPISIKGKCKEVINTSSKEYKKFDQYVFIRIKFPSFLVMSTIFLVPFFLVGYSDPWISCTFVLILLFTICCLVHNHHASEKSFDYNKMLNSPSHPIINTVGILHEVENIRSRNIQTVKLTFKIIKFCILLLVIGPIENKIQDLFDWTTNLHGLLIIFVLLIAIFFVILTIAYPLRWLSNAYHWFEVKLTIWIDHGLFVKDFTLYTATSEALKLLNKNCKYN